jgi:NAD(P)-dependent dehydrogenase (short-subunit alcohol dehydrogenase family)
MGRIGNADEIADLVVYLTSAESRYMTGQCIVIDGGMSL